jgi:pimeloyl-ACP methyl ester carboxylesterase
MLRPAGRDDPPALVIIPGAGGFGMRKDKLVQACDAHGETILLDYPSLQWTLQHADLPRVAEEMHARIRRRMARRPFVLAGASLGAIVAALIAQRDRGELQLIRVVGIDPAGSLEQAGSGKRRLEAGWLARNLVRVRHAGFGGSPEFIWVRLNRVFAIILARWLRRHGRMARPVAWLIACAGLRRFSQQLRMRLLIDMTTAWRRDPARHCDDVSASKVPCMVLQTSATRFDAGFWEKHFDSVRVAQIGGDHDTWYDFDGPRLVIDAWDDASERGGGQSSRICSRAALAHPS